MAWMGDQQPDAVLWLGTEEEVAGFLVYIKYGPMPDHHVIIEALETDLPAMFARAQKENS